MTPGVAFVLTYWANQRCTSNALSPTRPNESSPDSRKASRDFFLRFADKLS